MWLLILFKEENIMCLFEPIEGRYPLEEMCDRHPDCEGCPYSYEEKENK